MTMAKQDPEAWRRRVDKKLNSLTKGHAELKDRMDKYEKTVNDKLDILIVSTEGLVKFHNRVKFTKKVAKFVGEFLQRLMGWVIQIGLTALTLGAAYWVYLQHNDWWTSVKNFVTTFNGGTLPKS